VDDCFVVAPLRIDQNEGFRERNKRGKLCNCENCFCVFTERSSTEFCQLQVVTTCYFAPTGLVAMLAKVLGAI
jgi:hypothetical protein